MRADTIRQIVEFVSELPESVRGHLATDSDRVDLENEVGDIHPDHWWYLTTIGNCPIGSEWIDGIEQIRASNAKFRDESDFWNMRDVVIVCWDSSGDPVGIDRDNGRVITEHHDGPPGIHELAPSFGEFLAGLITQENE